MPTDFPLWRLRPEDAARIIINIPTEHVAARKFEHKREMRLRPSHRSAPRADDLKTLDKANNDRHWYEYKLDQAEEFPRISLLIGPLLKDGTFFTPQHVANALGAERPRDPFQGMYSRAQFEADTAYLEETRALLRENFILGQRHEGPYLDGVIYLRTDNMILAEMDRLKSRLRATWAIIESAKLAKKLARPKIKEHKPWQNIGNNEAVAYKFKQSGYVVRKIELPRGKSYWEVQAK